MQAKQQQVSDAKHLMQASTLPSETYAKEGSEGGSRELDSSGMRTSTIFDQERQAALHKTKKMKEALAVSDAAPWLP